jgi:catechol 2,3-dioxygenase-like lactoylglutathione lyase family enzyme
MAITGLNHIFVRATDLARTRQFYVDVLGLTEMPRPPFPFPGHWLGTHGQVQVHIGPSQIANRSRYYLGTPDDAADNQTGTIDHVAFVAESPQAFIDRFAQQGLAFRARSLKDMDLYQLFVKDPNGVMIELNFPGLTEHPSVQTEEYTEMAPVGVAS